MKGVKKGRAELYCCSGSSVGASVPPVLLVKGAAAMREKVFAEYWKGEKKVRNGDWGEEATNCELKCYLLSKAELLKSCVTWVRNE